MKLPAFSILLSVAPSFSATTVVATESVKNVRGSLDEDATKFKHARVVPDVLSKEAIETIQRNGRLGNGENDGVNRRFGEEVEDEQIPVVAGSLVSFKGNTLSHGTNGAEVRLLGPVNTQDLVSVDNIVVPREQRLLGATTNQGNKDLSPISRKLPAGPNSNACNGICTAKEAAGCEDCADPVPQSKGCDRLCGAVEFFECECGSANPTLAPTYPCFASEAGGYRYEDEDNRRHLRDPVPSSELSHRALQDEWKTWPCEPPGQTCVLFEAVRDYYAQDCDSNTTCDIGQLWGHPIGSWCVGSVVNMQSLFSDYTPGGLPNNITSDLSGWDTSSAEAMNAMFYGQTLFNGNLPWDVSQVKETNDMFNGAESFNGDLLWDTSSVTDMNRMFLGSSSFNGDLSQWDTSSVTKMNNMFNGAESFNGDLSQWDTSSVTKMRFVFYRASSFNGNLSQWDTSSVTDMYAMFKYASSFNSSGSISNWNVTNVVFMGYMFEGATDFAQNLCPWKDAPAVSLTNCYYSQQSNQPCTSGMFTDSSGQPNDGSGGFNATACN